MAWSHSTLLHQRGSALAKPLKRHFEAMKLLRAQFGEHSLHLPGMLSKRRNNKVLAARGEGDDAIVAYIETAHGCADEDEQVPASWLDFVAPSELIPQVDPALNSNEVAVTAPSRGNYTTLSRGNQKTLHLVMYCRGHRAKVRMRVRRGDMWMRSCAACKALLRKLRLCDSVRCQCGWTW